MDDIKNQVRETEARNLLAIMKDLEQTADIENMLKDNIIVFKIREENYRVRKPTSIEQLEVEEFRRKKYLDLIKDSTYMFRKQWIEIYKEKGIDIDKMDHEMVEIQNDINQLFLRLAKTESKNDIEKLKTDIINKKKRQAEISVEKSNLLNYSIEDQLLVAINSFYSFVVLEKVSENQWTKVFKTHKEFMESNDTELINKTFYYINFLIYNNSF